MLFEVRTYLWSRNRFLRLFGSQFFHGIVVLFLFLCHEDVLTSKVKGYTDLVIIIHYYTCYTCLLMKISHEKYQEEVKIECVLSFSSAG